MDSGEVMMKNTVMPTVQPQQLVASTLENPSQTGIQEAPALTAYIPPPPLSFDDIHAAMDSWPARDIHSSTTGRLGATHVSIQDIRELVGHGNPWLARLYSTTDFPLRCSRLPTQELFDRGFRAIQQCFNGSLTDSLEDVISLVHVACALAYSLHKDEDLYDWDGHFLHMFQWRHLLSNRDDVQCFLKVMGQLSREHNHHLTYPFTGRSIPDKEIYESAFEMLRNGPIMRDCSMFLDCLEYRRLYERNQNGEAQYFDRAFDMIDSITTPLRDNPHTEWFLNLINDIELQLLAGLLHNPREVEVMLIINGRVCSS